MTAILRAALAYFALVFGAGFVLGPIRVLLLEPRIGARWAELLEMPVMLAVMIFAARWIVGRHWAPRDARGRLGLGMLALGLMLAAEFGFVLRLRGMSLEDYFASRDPVSGTVYYVMLGVFAALPVIFGRRR